MYLCTHCHAAGYCVRAWEHRAPGTQTLSLPEQQERSPPAAATPPSRISSTSTGDTLPFTASSRK